ncbi:MAG TPA: efflux RND transporter periplasmic adaptor subunit [Gemmatimonadaceae bacterium]|nr:efflux RND transporter periplasmic adaptor subunit [Gemmatimonadaceae bacterium]
MSSQTITRGARAPLGSTLRLAGCAGVAVLLAACGGKDEATSDSAAPAAAAPAAAIVLGPQDLVTAQRAEIGSSLTLSGPLEPKNRVTLRAMVPGTVQSLRVDRGTAVRRGQVLATIRAEGVQSQAAGARAGVAAANANLAVARQRFEAARRLHQAGAMSDIDLRTAQAGFESAEAQVAAARAQAASAGEAAGFTTITSPIAGVVSDRKVDQGEAVNPGSELLSVVDSRVLELRAQIGVGEAGRVRVGQSVSFTLDAFPGEQFSGRVARIDPTADPATRQVTVYVELANPTGRIIGGQFARGSIAMASSQAVVVPATAVQGTTQNATSGTVFVVVNGKLARRAVTLGARDDATGRVAVLSGLAAGEQVVATPTAELTEGAPVTVANDNAPTTPPAGAATPQE